jgi:hypothetical protein
MTKTPKQKNMKKVFEVGKPDIEGHVVLHK